MITRIVNRTEKVVAYMSLVVALIGLGEKGLHYFALARKNARKRKGNFGFNQQQKGRTERWSTSSSRA